MMTYLILVVILLLFKKNYFTITNPNSYRVFYAYYTHQINVLHHIRNSKNHLVKDRVLKDIEDLIKDYDKMYTLRQKYISPLELLEYKILFLKIDFSSFFFFYRISFFFLCVFIYIILPVITYNPKVRNFIFKIIFKLRAIWYKF